MPLDVCGQTADPVTLECITDMGPIPIFLGIVLVINNLGTSCLIGEPAKKRNNIVCLPRQKLVVLAAGDKVHCVPYAESLINYSLVRALSNCTLLPGESLSYALADHLSEEPVISLIPRPSSLTWLSPAMIEPSEGAISLVNSSNVPVSISKGDHLADLRNTKVFEVKQFSFPTIASHDDKFQFKDFSRSRHIDPLFLKQIQVDPDGILSPEERNIFHTLHQRFAKLFTKQPGKYNGLLTTSCNLQHHLHPTQGLESQITRLP